MRYIVLATVLLAGCAAQQPPLDDYRPVIDPARVDMAKFERDLPECREIGKKIYAEHAKKARDQMFATILIGAALGAASGAMIDNDYAGAGAVGGATGAAAGAIYQQGDLERGPKVIVDRCMANRGHEILASG